MSEQQYILSIAGFDPSGGAGITSDIKTFQAHGLYGLAVCTTVTVQNDLDFKASHWVAVEVILEQLETLFERFEIKVVKIGIVENWEILMRILERLEALSPEVKVVLDPVLKATSGYDFHAQSEEAVLDTILEKVYVVTPNYEEIEKLYPEKSIEETIEHISGITNLYLKGGHRTDTVGLDQLFYNTIVQLNIAPEGLNVSPKHGSGCVLSSALASNLRLALPIEEAAVLAKRYTEQFLASTTGLLGNHKTTS